MTPEAYAALGFVALFCVGAIWVSSPGKPPRVVDPLPPGLDQTKAWKAWSDKLRSEEGGR